jgi:hypothetical protein
MPHQRKKRTSKARYRIMVGKTGAYIALINSKGRVVSTIHGPSGVSVEEMHRTARQMYPDARRFDK